MKILKYVLWIALTFCLSWAGAISFGPELVSRSASYLSDGRIGLTRVNVSPSLKISAAVVDFSFPLTLAEQSLIGQSRAVSIDWKVLGGFELSGQIGPTKLEGFGALTSANFTLKPISFIEWDELNIQFESELLSGNNFELAQAKFTGKFIHSSQELKNAIFVASKIRGETENIPFEATVLKVNTDYYKIGQPLYQQNSEVEFRLEKTKLPRNALGAALVGGVLKLTDGELDLDVLVNDLRFFESGLKVRDFKLTPNAPKKLPLVDGLEGTWEFLISEIESKDPAFKIENYNGQITYTPEVVLHKGRAVFSKIEIKNDQLFIGQIKKGIIDVTLSSRTSPSGINLAGQGLLTMRDVADFSASMSFESVFPKFSLLNCEKQMCGAEAIKADYQIAASGSVLTGSLECEMANCLSQPKQHIIKTDNTNRFFQALSNTGILSPLSLPIAYLAISSGEVIGDGHQIKF